MSASSSNLTPANREIRADTQGAKEDKQVAHKEPQEVAALLESIKVKSTTLGGAAVEVSLARKVMGFVHTIKDAWNAVVTPAIDTIKGLGTSAVNILAGRNAQKLFAQNVVKRFAVQGSHGKPPLTQTPPLLTGHQRQPADKQSASKTADRPRPVSQRLTRKEMAELQQAIAPELQKEAEKLRRQSSLTDLKPSSKTAAPQGLSTASKPIAEKVLLAVGKKQVTGLKEQLAKRDKLQGDLETKEYELKRAISNAPSAENPKEAEKKAKANLEKFENNERPKILEELKKINSEISKITQGEAFKQIQNSSEGSVEFKKMKNDLQALAGIAQTESEFPGDFKAIAEKRSAQELAKSTFERAKLKAKTQGSTEGLNEAKSELSTKTRELNQLIAEKSKKYETPPTDDPAIKARYEKLHAQLQALKIAEMQETSIAVFGRPDPATADRAFQVMHETINNDWQFLSEVTAIKDIYQKAVQDPSLTDSEKKVARDIIDLCQRTENLMKPAFEKLKEEEEKIWNGQGTDSEKMAKIMDLRSGFYMKKKEDGTTSLNDNFAGLMKLQMEGLILKVNLDRTQDGQGVSLAEKMTKFPGYNQIFHSPMKFAQRLQQYHLEMNSIGKKVSADLVPPFKGAEKLTHDLNGIPDAILAQQPSGTFDMQTVRKDINERFII